MTRSALTVPLLVAALVLTGCTAALPAAPASIAAAPAPDTTCIGGMGFVRSYSAIAGRYDPKLETDRQQLAATRSLATARALLDDIAVVLEAYDSELRPLKPTSDLADAFDGLLGADQHLHDGALTLAGSPFGPTDQAAFQKVAGDRQAALHDLRLEVSFVTSECT